MKRLVLSFFGSGYLRPAPGTWGSLAALPAAYCIYLLGGPLFFAGATFLAFSAGVATIRAEAAENPEGDHDPSWIVIDEVVGQWIALWPVAFGAWSTGVSVLALWPGILTAFVFFRLFDIWKPGPIGVVDQRDDAIGVMLDDVLAGAFAAVIVMALAGLAHMGIW